MSESPCTSKKLEPNCNGDQENYETYKLTKKWEKFHNWLHCICIVTFDLELGQAIEAIYPSHVNLSPTERSNICYLAFPDSNSGCKGDTNYHIRIRQSQTTISSSYESNSIKEYNKKSVNFLQSEKYYYWGYVYFRQVKDKTLPRGYFQKSVVLISKLPFVNLFNEIVSLLAPEYFDIGKTVMDVAIDEINNWQNPIPGKIINLPLLGVLIQSYIPNKNYKAIIPLIVNSTTINNNNNNNNNNIDTTKLLSSLLSTSSSSSSLSTSSSSSSSSTTSSPTTSINKSRRRELTSAYEGDIFSSLSSIISHIHLIWELVLLCEPIVIMTGSPIICSEMVQALVSTITPLKYFGDYRPYFTIHDSEFKEYTSDTTIPPAVILGVTNPFFAKTLQHWPHIIRICNNLITNKNNNSSNNNNNNDFINNQKCRIKKNENLKILDSKPGVYTEYKPYLQKDKIILKKLLKGIQTKRPTQVQTALLKRHLMDLTESFMIPLERYIATLMPLQKNISPFKATPIPNRFNQDDFLATLPTAGPQLTIGIKGDWVGLYKKFFLTPNFSGWFQSRHTELTQKLQALQLESLSQVDINNWVKDKQEVEIVDMILRIRQKLKKSYDDDVPITQLIRDNLCKKINDMTHTLPDDLKIILCQES